MRIALINENSQAAKNDMLEAKTDLSKLIRMLETKQEDVIYLARNGKAVVQMTLIPKKLTQKRIGVAEGKFKVPDAFDAWDKEISGYCLQAGYEKLTINEKHIFAMSDLKRKEGVPPHKAPFDRMLICQALVENMMFVAHDTLIPGYNVPFILAV